MIEEFVGAKVVVDFASQYVALGTLKRIDANFLELKNADLHDLRDTDSTREIYVAESVRTGIKRNRKSVILSRSDVVAVTRFDEIVDE